MTLEAELAAAEADYARAIAESDAADEAWFKDLDEVPLVMDPVIERRQEEADNRRYATWKRCHELRWRLLQAREAA